MTGVAANPSGLSGLSGLSGVSGLSTTASGADDQTDLIATNDETGAPAELVDVYRQHYPRLVRALELSGIDRTRAEDIAQEAFARTIGHWWRVRRGSNPAGYVYRVAFRQARRSLPPELPLADRRLADDVAVEATTRASVDAVLAAMPPGRRICAVLCLLAGLSPKEAARALGIADSTVRKHLERARSDLRTGLSAAGNGPGPATLG